MQFVSSREFRIRPGEVWKRLKQQDLVVTSNGKPVAILARISEDDFEDTLILLRRLRAQMAVDRMRKAAAQAAPVTEEEMVSEYERAIND